MAPVPALAAIAREKNWMEFAILLEEAMAQPALYGLASPNAVRASVSRMRRQLPSSFVTALKAAQYLRERHPAVLAARDARIACAPVRLLARIDEISPVAARDLAPDVFDGRLRQAELRAYLTALEGSERCAA